MNRQRAFFFLIAVSLLPLQAFGEQFDAKLDAPFAMMAREVGITLPALTNHFGLDLSSARPTINVLVLTSGEGVSSSRRQVIPLRLRSGLRTTISSTLGPVEQLYVLAALPHVFFVEAVKRYRPTLDQSIPEARANLVRSRNPNGSFNGTTGKGVIVGIIDSGVDWRHLDFRKPDGTTRLKFLWDPSDDSFRRLGIGSPHPLLAGWALSTRRARSTAPYQEGGRSARGTNWDMARMSLESRPAMGRGRADSFLPGPSLAWHQRRTS